MKLDNSMSRFQVNVDFDSSPKRVAEKIADLLHESNKDLIGIPYFYILTIKNEQSVYLVLEEL